jgi:hypothetical protein
MPDPYENMAADLAKKQRKDEGNDKSNIDLPLRVIKGDREIRVYWTPPHPTQVHSLVKEAMERADDKILAQAFRKLAIAAANSERSGSFFEKSATIEWLKDHISNCEWALDFIENYVDTEADVHTAIRENVQRWKECEWCGDPFVYDRITAKYCTPHCRIKAHRARKK